VRRLKIKEIKYRDGMLRGSEVSKDSCHSPVKNKKINTILKKITN